MLLLEFQPFLYVFQNATKSKKKCEKICQTYTFSGSEKIDKIKCNIFFSVTRYANDLILTLKFQYVYVIYLIKLFTLGINF